MPSSAKTLDPAKAKTARRTSVWDRKVKPTLKVGETYLYTRHLLGDSTKEVDRGLVTVIDRKVTGKVTTVAVIVVKDKYPTQVIRGLRVRETDDWSMQSECLVLYGEGCCSWDQEWLYAHNRVTNL